MKTLSNALNSITAVEKPAIETTRDHMMQVFILKKVILELGDEKEIIE